MDRDHENATQLFFSGLADETRLRIMNLLRDGEVCVLDLTRVLGLSQPKISRHLAYLRSSGLVEPRRSGKWMHYAICWSIDEGRNEALRAALQWLGQLPSMQEELAMLNLISRPADRNEYARENAANAEAAPTYPDERPPEGVRPAFPRPRHNELDEFLL